MNDPTDIDELVQRAVRGDQRAAAVLFSQYEDRLKRIVQLRLDRRLYGRVGASDIVQEAMIEASRRLSEFSQAESGEFFLWLRQLTGQKLIDAHRCHLGTKKRNAHQEVSLYQRPMPEATSAALAAQLLGRLTSPTQAVQRIELQIQVQEALNNLEPIDREVLVLRHFEHLSNSQVALVLGISKSAASKRFIVAIKRLKDQLQNVPGLADRF